MIKLIAFDLDGTLTQHKTPLEKENRAVLDELVARGYTLLMVGAGQCARIFRQMGEYPIDIIGNYGLQETVYERETGSLRTVRDLAFPVDRESIHARVSMLREKHGFTNYRGESVEFHPSGCVTFAVLGTEALQADKLAFDPDRKKRRAIYDEVVATFPEYTVFVGGSSSFDMAPKPYNKLYALSAYAAARGISHEEIAFVGDDYGPGGNDESVYLSDIRFFKVDDYTRLREALSDLLGE
jgi:HAD superfamily hydrolase (TIGR01484 family)